MRSPRDFLKNDHGVALLEFVLVFPFLFLLLFGSIEVIRLLYLQQRVEKAGYVIADVVTRYAAAKNPLTVGQISVTEMNTNVFPLFKRIMNENAASDTANRAVIVTSIVKESGTKRVKWQIASPGGNLDNTLTGCDSLGNCVTSIVNGLAPGSITGAVVNTPTSFPAAEESTLATMPDNENLIVAEVFYYYHPILKSLLQGVGTVTKLNFYLPDRIYVKRTYFTPRNDNLTYLPPTFPVP